MPFRIPKNLSIPNKKEGKDQESIQSSTTPDPGYQWESDNFTIRHHKRELRGQLFPIRHQLTDAHKSKKHDRNNITDPQKKHRLGTVSENILLVGFNMFHGAPASPLVQMGSRRKEISAESNTNVSSSHTF